MAVCQICNKDRFMVYKRYQDHKLHPPRCLGCIVRFPVNGTQLAINGDELKSYVRLERRYHGWSLVKQTKQYDIWFCPYCKLTLVSPKLGIPTAAGCMRGSAYKLRKGWWGHVKLEQLCPLCDGKAELLQVVRIIKKRPGKNHFPFTCRKCFGVET